MKKPQPKFGWSQAIADDIVQRSAQLEIKSAIKSTMIHAPMISYANDIIVWSSDGSQTFTDWYTQERMGKSKINSMRPAVENQVCEVRRRQLHKSIVPN